MYVGWAFTNNLKLGEPRRWNPKIQKYLDKGINSLLPWKQKLQAHHKGQNRNLHIMDNVISCFRDSCLYGNKNNRPTKQGLIIT